MLNWTHDGAVPTSPIPSQYVEEFGCDSYQVSGNSYRGELGQLVVFTLKLTQAATKVTFYEDMPGGGGSYSSEVIYDDPGNTGTLEFTHSLRLEASGGLPKKVHFYAKYIYGVEYSTDTIEIEVYPNEFPSFDPLDVKLQVQNLPGTRVRLQWPSAQDNVGIRHYNVYRSTSEFSDPRSPSVTLINDAAAGNTWTDTSVEDGRTYYYCVTGVDYAGNETLDASVGTRTTVESIYVDGTAPTLVGFSINSTSITSNAKILVPRGESVLFTVNASEQVSVFVEVNSTTAKRSYTFEPSAWTQVGNWKYQAVWDTQLNVERRELVDGTYNVTVRLTDQVGNVLWQTFVDAVRVGSPPKPVNWAPIVFGLVVAAAGAGGTVAAVKFRGRKRVDEEVAAIQRRRKGEIHKGASALGRASGRTAEELVRTRRGGPAPPATGRKPPGPNKPRGRGTGGTASRPPAKPKPSVATGTPPPSSSRSISRPLAQPTSSALAGGAQVDLGRQMDFLSSKVSSLETVFGMVTMLVGFVPDRPTCQRCGRELSGSWKTCPWCLLEEKTEELSMKASIATFEGKVGRCPSCGRTLPPAWGNRCPYCATK
ncbi:MAG: hypothetical protein Kow0069_10890 [Promethearchaeota archaeon]